MKIAIVTGASSGMGRKFVLALDNMESIISNKKAMKFDEIWVIARRNVQKMFYKRYLFLLKN